jgi:hypothetical protein
MKRVTGNILIDSFRLTGMLCSASLSTGATQHVFKVCPTRQRHLPSIIDKAIDSKNEIHSAPLGHSKKESSIYHRIDEHKLIRFLPTLAQ